MTRKLKRKHPSGAVPSIDRRLFEATVQDMASDGRAVVKHPDGRTFFVPGAWLNERIQVRPTGQQGKVAFGHLVAVLEKSGARVIPSCPHHGHSDGKCGGCPWMMASSDGQLSAKVQRLTYALERLGASQSLQPIIAAPSPLGYRNRAQFKTDGRTLGYVSMRSNTLVPIDECKVLSDANQRSLTELLTSLPNQSWQPKGRSPWVTIDIDDQASDFQIDARMPFRQGNSAQNVVMQDWLAAECRRHKSDTAVLELFCGGGNFTEVLVKAGFTHIVAAEVGAVSLSDLASRDWPQVTPLEIDLFDEESVERLARRHKNTQLMVLDPPREGLKVRAPLLKKLRALETVLYISCDLATWARDAADFQASGFMIDAVTPIDLFPQTPHLELLSRLVRAR